MLKREGRSRIFHTHLHYSNTLFRRVYAHRSNLEKECIEALNGGREQWRDLCHRNPTRIPDLSDCHFKEKNLDGWDFSKTDFSGSRFEDSSLKNAIFYKSNLTYSSFERSFLQNSNLDQATLKGARFFFTEMDGTTLKSASLGNTEFRYTQMVETDFSDAKKYPGVNIEHSVTFSNCEMYGACFSNADLQETVFEQNKMVEINFNEAVLKRTVFKSCNMTKGYFINADLTSADLHGAKLSRSNFKHANLESASFKAADLTSADLTCTDMLNCNFCEAQLSFVKYNRFSRYRGIRVDNLQGGMIFQRFALDQKYLEEFRAISDVTRLGGLIIPKPTKQDLKRTRNWFTWLFYLFWLVSSDCGRSVLLWLAQAVMLSFLFAYIFYTIGIDSPDIDSVFGSSIIVPSLPSTWHSLPAFISVPLEYCSTILDAQFWKMLYYSIVTFTTLGFGDIIPKTYEVVFWVSLEVGLGYIMLGMLISIMANKFARRSG